MTDDATPDQVWTDVTPDQVWLRKTVSTQTDSNKDYINDEELIHHAISIVENYHRVIKLFQKREKEIESTEKRLRKIQDSILIRYSLTYLGFGLACYSATRLLWNYLDGGD